MHVMSIRRAISVPSIKYSLQCTLTASAREADGDSAVTGNGRGVGMVKPPNPIYMIPVRLDNLASQSGEDLVCTCPGEYISIVEVTGSLNPGAGLPHRMDCF